MKRAARLLIALVVAFGMVMATSGCKGYYAGGYSYEPKPGPPPWAPAHGKRAKYRYHYYPDAGVYFDAGRGIYFYLSGGTWQSSSRLPVSIRITGSYVSIEMDADKPYKFHSDVVKRYPPGQTKKQEKEKGKGKKKH